MKLNHRNIVMLIGSVLFENRTCAVMPIAARGSVKEIIDKGPLSLLRSSRDKWILDVARGKIASFIACFFLNF